MYYANQTLRNLHTNQLVALYPSKRNGSAFNWEMTDFIDETGRVFKDDIKNYGPIKDWFGNGMEGTDRTQNKYVDLTLKKYLVSPEKRKKNKEILLKECSVKLLKRIEESTKVEVRNVFWIDGNPSHEFSQYFFKFVKAKPLVILYDSFAEFPPHTKYKKCSMWFTHKGKRWMCDERHSEFVRIHRFGVKT